MDHSNRLLSTFASLTIAMLLAGCVTMHGGKSSGATTAATPAAPSIGPA